MNASVRQRLTQPCPAARTPCLAARSNELGIITCMEQITYLVSNKFFGPESPAAVGAVDGRREDVLSVAAALHIELKIGLEQLKMELISLLDRVEGTYAVKFSPADRSLATSGRRCERLQDLRKTNVSRR